MSLKTRHGLHYQRWWMALGCLMVAAVVALSLLSVSGPVTAPGFDKIYHAIAYGAMMFWWGMVQPRRRIAWGLALVALGIGLEFAQSLTGYRHPGPLGRARQQLWRARRLTAAAHARGPPAALVRPAAC